MQAAAEAREMDGRGPVGFDITDRNEARFQELMDIPGVSQTYKQFLEISNPTSEQKFAFVQNIYNVTIRESKFRANYDLYQYLLKKMLKDWGVCSSKQFLDILTLHAHNDSSGLADYLSRNFENKSKEQRQDFISQLIRINQDLSGWARAWHTAMQKIARLRVDSREKALSLENIMNAFYSSINQGRDEALGADELKIINVYLATCHFDNPALIVSQLEKINEKLSDTDKYGRVGYAVTDLITAYQKYSPIDVLNDIRSAKLADIDDQILEFFAKLRPDVYVPHDLNASFLSACKPTNKIKVNLLLQEWKAAVESSLPSIQIEFYYQLLRKQTLIDKIGAQAFYDYLLNIEIHAENLQKVLGYLDKFCDSHNLEKTHYSDAFWQKFPETFWQDLFNHYAKAEHNQLPRDQLANISILYELMVKAPVSLLKKIDAILVVESKNPAIQAIQRHLIRSVIKDSTELHKSAKAEFNQGLEERLSQRKFTHPMLKKQEEKTYWTAFGVSTILLAFAVVGLSFLSPLAGALAAAYIVPGFIVSLLGGYGIGKLSAKFHARVNDKKLRRDDEAIADGNKVVAKPGRIAKSDRVIPLSKKQQNIALGIFVAGAVIGIAAVLTAIVLCPPVAVLALPLAAKAAAIGGIGLAVFITPAVCGWLSLKAAMRCFFRKRTSAKASESAAEQSLLENEYGPGQESNILGDLTAYSAISPARHYGTNTPYRQRPEDNGAGTGLNVVVGTPGREYNAAQTFGAASQRTGPRASSVSGVGSVYDFATPMRQSEAKPADYNMDAHRPSALYDDATL
jgi:type IV secretory pathway component VirB8